MKKYFIGLDELCVWAAPFGLKLLEIVEYKKNITALDIGFGTGFPLTELAIRLGDSSLVYGIDPWKEAIELAKEKIDCYGITNIKIIEGVAESILLADNSVNLITSNNGINNVSDMPKVLSECSRILKPGGQFVFTMNLDKSMFEFYEQLECMMIEMGMHQEAEDMHQHIAEKRPSVDIILKRLREAGFVIKDLEYDQFNYRFADGSAMLNHYFIRIAFMDSWTALFPPDKAGEIFDRIEKQFNEYAQKYTGIKLSIPFILVNATK